MVLSRLQRVLAQTAAVAFCLVAGAEASAHWCDCLWASAYNVVVRPTSDTLQVPSNGEATLEVYVQNNMGYPLYEFHLDANASGYDIDITSAAPAVNGYLMPGERLLHTLHVQRSSGSATMSAEDVSFYVGFGNSGQDNNYGSSGRDVVIKKNDGSIVPSSPSVSAGDQAKHLGSLVKADYRNISGGIDDLMTEFCSGRNSWSNASPITSHCTGTSTDCPSRATDYANKYDYQHLWAGAEVAARRKELSASQRSVFRERLMCASNDSHDAFSVFAILMLGYLGDAANVRTFLEDLAGGSGAQANAAKAALYLVGDAQYRSAITSNVQSSNAYVSMISAAALGIQEADDNAVNVGLISRVQWREPTDDSSAEGLVAAHMLNLVAWHRRGYRTMSNDAGGISFYGDDVVPTPAPRAPQNVTCAIVGDAVRITWDEVTQDEGGGSVTVSQYRVYWGTEANSCPSTCTRPGEGAFTYAHAGVTNDISHEPANLTPGETYYFAVAAEDPQSQSSVYSTETSCTIPQTAEPPEAVLTCSPLSGQAPLTVTCHGNDSTCPGGSVAQHFLKLDANNEEETASKTYSFATAGLHIVRLRVVSDRGLHDTATAIIDAEAAAGENQPPVPNAAASPEDGAAPLTVSFDASGSSDPDGDSLTYAWDFDDGNDDAGMTVTHTFDNSGVYLATVTVTDNGSPALSSVSGITITVVANDNEPPDAGDVVVSPKFGEAPLTVTFDASAVQDPNGDNVSFAWDFGDGGESTQISGTHTFEEEGEYTITVIARDDAVPPQQSTESFTVTVLGSEKKTDSQTAVGKGGCVATATAPRFSALLGLLMLVPRLGRRRPKRCRHFCRALLI